MAVIYLVCGGTVAVVAAAVPQPPGASLTWIEVVCLTGVVLGLAVWPLPWDRWPRRASILLAVVAIGFISGFDAASSADGYRYGIFYVVVFAWVGLVQPKGTSLLLAPVLTVGYLGPLLATDHGWDAATASVLYVVVACAATGESVAWVSDHLRRTHDELVNAQRELAKNERLAAIGEMTTVIGHELRNPLGAAINSLFLVRNKLGEGMDPEVDAYLSRAERENNRAAALSEDLTTYMRERPPTIVTLDLAQVVSEVLESTPPPAGITVSTPAPGIAMTADKDQFLQVLINIVTNAYQAMPTGGSLTIAGSDAGTFTEITLQDTGPGIDPEVADRLFDPFVSAKANGTGLGLPIVKQIVEAHGGAVAIEPGPAGGARVILRIPRS